MIQVGRVRTTRDEDVLISIDTRQIRSLPRDIPSRVGLAVCSVLFGWPMGAGGVLLVFTVKGVPLGLAWVLLLLAEELLLAVGALSILGILWAVATPDWVEMLYRAIWHKIIWLIPLSAIPFIVFATLRILGII